MKIKPLSILIIIWLLIGHLLPVALAQRQGGVLVLTVDGPVSQTMLTYIQRGITAAQAQNAEAMVIQLDTPGGQIDLTREIVQAIVNSDVPIVVYVYPAGGFAASAGTFITLAGHVAAMAPQTTIGAASPVNGDGSDIDETIKSKVQNVLVADIENLAERRGEDVVLWATQAITEAKAASAKEALELGVIDFIAADIPDLMAQIDGFEIEIQGEARTLHTTGAPIQEFSMTVAEQILAVILRPEIAFLLLSIGPLAIIYEFINPGGYISGVIGVICLLVAFYALGQLPVNFAGIALIILAFVLFGAEIFTPTYGALTLTGAASLMLGGLFLFDEADLGYQISNASIIGTSASFGLFFFFIVLAALTALKAKPAAGIENLIGSIAIAKTTLNPTGTVFADGTRWQATLEEGGPVEAGEEVEITVIKGLKLKVRQRK